MRKIFCIVLTLFTLCFLCSSCKVEYGISAIQKTYTENADVILTFNGIKYYRLDYWAAQGKNVPLSYYDFYPYVLLEIQMENLQEHVDVLPTLEEYQYYFIAPKDTYYVFSSDSQKQPTLIFEKNRSIGGPSDGWYYFSKDFSFDMPTVEEDTVKEFLVLDDANQEIKRIRDTVQIQHLVDCCIQKENVIMSELLEMTQKSWTLYAVFANFPFAQKVATGNKTDVWYVLKNGETIYSKTGDASVS